MIPIHVAQASKQCGQFIDELRGFQLQAKEPQCRIATPTLEGNLME